MRTNILIGLLITIGLVTSVVAADWPQHLGPQRNGVSNEPAIASDFPNGKPPVVWTRPVGSGWAAPVVANDRVLIFHRLGNQEILESLEVQTGKVVWEQRYRTKYVDQFGFDEGPRSTPAVVNGRIITFGANGDLVVRQEKTGEEIWKRSILEEYRGESGYFGYACSPLVVGDRLVLNIGGRNAGIVAWDVRTGKELWRATDHEASYSSPIVTRFHDQDTLVFVTREAVVGLDPESGKIRFERPFRARLRESANAATPLAIGNELFVSASYRVGALLMKIAPDFQLQEVWSGDEVLSNHYNTSVEQDGYLFGIHDRQESRAKLSCVNWKTGKLQWLQRDFGCASLIRVRDRLIAVNEDGDLIVLAADPMKYRELIRVPVLASPVRAGTAFSNGQLYARDKNRLIRVNLQAK
ncbi:outer membrane protein assembly factor BamB family protein [Tuwongella immobilis]|uniref:Pyrrolo-quinoline quinone repeat domain-containing protein n=1 Tax=Tuwongella immobilis TaxID=692036 RepID=A0A6C2YNP9_9BACT|nr:PQQ-binding-like beta-propeller repeat protein [Tuwongella immobilis]VIP03248.1 Pyrrolo-quinoline quinone OS=Pedosphaera parvula (strain Ellin514) GN=Cflav_PD4382 PE=4 SV=1: PQQ_2 [Tuwongella immobilis]VTS03831.1 Pyrrolo-quinoline quinone OS=Pedosphaera parvula (strain Ellin514) GN=Cflav_PD4382 PE=4 SV=1: PQQ_2 [Tuwongella immobilis]